MVNMSFVDLTTVSRLLYAFHRVCYHREHECVNDWVMHAGLIAGDMRSVRLGQYCWIDGMLFGSHSNLKDNIATSDRDCWLLTKD